MAFLGLVPSEHSTGGRRRQGSITHTGNAHARRLLIESAWSYRFPARKTKHLAKAQQRPHPAGPTHRLEGPAALVRALRTLSSRAVQVTKVCVAVARELAGFVWAIAHRASRAQAH